MPHSREQRRVRTRPEPQARGPRPTVVRTAVAAALLGFATLLGPGVAHASCAEEPIGPPELGDDDHVFAGVVERTTDGGVAAEVRVVDVWRGRDLPPRVVVVGGALGIGVDSSTDRHYRAGDELAFFVSRGDDGVLYDNVCTQTGSLASLAYLDPPGVRLPDASADAVADPRSVLSQVGSYRVSAAIAVSGGLLATWVLRRRRDRRTAFPGVRHRTVRGAAVRSTRWSRRPRRAPPR